jgi:predicted GNAT family acetyltransferase
LLTRYPYDFSVTAAGLSLLDNPIDHALGRAHALLAMAGERTRVPASTEPGFTEVSGVRTHPDARGRGYAHTLIARVHQPIRARGDVPYLHSWSANASAIAVYQRLGYALRRRFHLQA